MSRIIDIEASLARDVACRSTLGAVVHPEGRWCFLKSQLSFRTFDHQAESLLRLLPPSMPNRVFGTHSPPYCPWPTHRKTELARRLDRVARRRLGRSLSIRQVDAG